ncbi:MAG: MBL fold metallo-hydrolase, partial [Desulfuromonadaceae bacterium]
KEQFAGFSFEPIPLFHSLRAPAVALRINRENRTLLYAPDIAALTDPIRDLAGIDLYIGDGSTFDDSLRRMEGGQPCGHAPMEQQLDWCAMAGVPQVLFTHCGEEIVTGNETDLQNRVRALGQARNLKAAIAWDGLEWQLE